MPCVSFDLIHPGRAYPRKELAAIWGYASFHAIARGVVTPKDDNKILLFVTEEKQSTAEPYADKFLDGRLDWEGPTDHFGDDRIVNARHSGDEIHLFYRSRHREDFTYVGRLELINHALASHLPSRFTFHVLPAASPGTSIAG